jgi:NAD(P)H-dependent FMN reductase
MSDVLIVCASSGKNLEMSEMLAQQFQTVEAEVLCLDALQLPLYSVPYEAEHGIPQQIQTLATKIHRAKAMIFAAPEYNGGTPPVLNNFIAWMSRSGKDWRAAFNGKVALIANYSSSGGPRCLGIMRNQLAYIGMNVMGREFHATASRGLDQKYVQDTLALFEAAASIS